VETGSEVEPSADRHDRVSWRWPGGRPDPRLQQEIAELRLRLHRSNPADIDVALEFLELAESELHRPRADNENGWAWLHAARREELRVLPPADLALLAIDMRQEAKAKLGDWRRKAFDKYDWGSEPLIDRVVRLQKHLDETTANDNRKRRLQRRQLLIYLGFLVGVLLVICLLEFLGRGLILTDSPVDGWWVVSSVLYGSLGGAFSSAQRVAAAGPASRYPGLRWAQLANTFRPMAGGAGALVAFAALQADLLGATVGPSGSRLAVISFVAGFSERFIPSLAARQEQSK
jgi:hypothetical protein